MTEQPDRPDEAGAEEHAEDRAEDRAEDVDQSQVDPGTQLDDLDPDAGVARSSTGHPAVDEVLRSLDGLDGRPVDEHVAAFERAHEGLRGALADADADASHATVSREA